MPAAPAPTDRVGRVEQQIADLQAMVAALESLVKTRPDVTLPQEGAAGDAGQGVGNAAGLTARIDAIETQMGALTSQLELMTQQLGALEARHRRRRRRATATRAAASRGTRGARGAAAFWRRAAA